MNKAPHLIAAIVALLTATAAQSQTDNILGDDGKFVPAITFTATHTERVAMNPEDKSMEVIPTERFAAKVVANLSGFDASQLSAQSPIAISIGSFNFTGTINDLLPVDRSGNKIPFNAKFHGGTCYYLVDKVDSLGNPVMNTKGSPVQLPVGSASFAWTASRLMITIADADVIGTAVGSTLNDLNLLGLADNGSVGGSLVFANEALPVAVTFGTATGSRPAYARGCTKTIHTLVSGVDTPINSATLQGVADITPPTISASVPNTDGGAGTINIAGSVVDIPGGTLPNSISIPVVDVEVYLNDPDYTNPIPADDVSAPTATGKHTFTFTSLPLNPGTNAVVIVATDESGNFAILKKTVSSTATAN